MSSNQLPNKYLVLRKGKGLLFLYYKGNRLMEAEAESEGTARIGTITIGRIKNIVENIKAAFVEFAPGELGFLPLSELPLIQGKKAHQEQEIVVQLKKDAVKEKQPVLTTQLSISGKYCVVTNGRPGLSFSGKLPDSVKKNLRSYLDTSYDRTFGIIVRTGAGELKDDRPVLEELVRLQEELSAILQSAASRTCYSVLFKKRPDYLTKLQDFPKGMIDEVLTDDPVLYEEIEGFQRESSFELPPVRCYFDKHYPLTKLYSVETKLQEALAKKVWLKSGGYLIIEPTEALTVIDVNTGKFTGNKSKEETFLKMNLEAAEEIGIQLSLRNLSGIIIVDFINMKPQEHKKQLLDCFTIILKNDRIKTSVPQMTTLGLVEFTRKKTVRPLADQLAELNE